jgi:GMP synthase-like glutamine amidotransferase
MLVYVDLEHERLQTDDPERGRLSYANRLRVKYRLEDIAGQPCLILRYHQVTPELLRELKVTALLVSGNATEFAHYSAARLAGLRAVLRAAAYPTLAFCGGCQILAQTYGAAIGPIGPLPAGVTDPLADNMLAPGMIQERGFMPVQVVRSHPLFVGLGTAPVFFESHYWEVKAPPPGFSAYAATEKCQLQMLAHESLPLIAVQFHPEFYDDEHPDGQTLLANFFRYAGVLR